MSQPSSWEATGLACSRCDGGRMWRYRLNGSLCCDSCPTIRSVCKEDLAARHQYYAGRPD